jgi:hypothetical protein
LLVAYIYDKIYFMAAGKYSFTIEQGSTLNFEIQYKDSGSNPVDLTGYSGKMMIRSSYADSNPTTYITLSSSRAADGTGLNFSGSNGTTPPTSGSIGVYISANSSSAFAFTTARYDLEITSGSVVTRILEGQVN